MKNLSYNLIIKIGLERVGKDLLPLNLYNNLIKLGKEKGG